MIAYIEVEYCINIYIASKLVPYPFEKARLYINRGPCVRGFRRFSPRKDFRGGNGRGSHG